MKKLIETNIYIFKENLKLVVNCCVDQMCGHQTQSDRLDKLILKEAHQGHFSAIREEEEDGPISEGVSKTSTDKAS